MHNRILICTDLDRTLLPNGEQAESPQARPYFAVAARRPEVDIAYVTGRHMALVKEAIEEYSLPSPNYVLGDVGSTIYEISGNNWQPWTDWQEEIAPCWGAYRHDRVAELFKDITILRQQEAEKQNTFKLSYYVPPECDLEALLSEMRLRLQQNRVRAGLIWSIDDLTHTGLLDVLPENATKLHAIEFLMRQKGYAHANTLFAGDSGNDLPVLASGINSVLVANAREEVRLQALTLASQQNHSRSLYIAKGGYLGMNGNYSAGILEGLSHFIPASHNWFD